VDGGESKKGVRHRAIAFIDAAGDRRRRGGSRAAAAWKRETGGDRGPWHGGRWPAPARGRRAHAAQH
jgi:hypothetical protein